MHDVGGTIGDEAHALYVGRQAGAAIDQGRRHAAIIAGSAIGAEHLAPITAVQAKRRVRRPDVGLFLIDQIFIEAARAHQIGVTGIIIRRHIIDKQGIGVDVAIDAPGIILGDAPLAAAQARHGDELASLVRHVPLMLGNDQQIVHPPEQTVGTMFQHAKPGETVGDLFLGISLQIAIGIAGLPQRWRFADQRAAASQDLESARQHQLVSKHSASIGARTGGSSGSSAVKNGHGRFNSLRGGTAKLAAASSNGAASAATAAPIPALRRDMFIFLPICIRAAAGGAWQLHTVYSMRHSQVRSGLA